MVTHVVFMTALADTAPVLRTLVEAGFEVTVYTQPDKPTGRGRRLVPPSIKTLALKMGLPLYQPTTLKSSQPQQGLAALKPDVIILAAYGKLLPPTVLALPPHGCVNIHPSLLPRYRGPSPVVTAILKGENRTGVTLMLMDESMDTGPILAQQEHHVGTDDTAEKLTVDLFSTGAALLMDTLPRWMAGKLTPKVQDESQATYTRKIKREDGEAQWELSAADLERRVRAFFPRPSLFTRWEGRLVKVMEAGVVHQKVEGRPGQVVPLSLPEAQVGVITGRGVLALKRLQMEGGKLLTSQEFLRGHQQFIGSRLPN